MKRLRENNESGSPFLFMFIDHERVINRYDHRYEAECE